VTVINLAEGDAVVSMAIMEGDHSADNNTPGVNGS
jgi:hypothetical protein